MRSADKMITADEMRSGNYDLPAEDRESVYVEEIPVFIYKIDDQEPVGVMRVRICNLFGNLDLLWEYEIAGSQLDMSGVFERRLVDAEALGFYGDTYYENQEDGEEWIREQVCELYQHYLENNKFETVNVFILDAIEDPWLPIHGYYEL